MPSRDSSFRNSSHKYSDLERLKTAIRAKLGVLVRLNRMRADLAETFEVLIESDNAGSRSIEQLFEDLLALSQTLDDEQERHVREHTTEEELVIFDILTRPAPEFCAVERDEVKREARTLLSWRKELSVLNWQKSAARAALTLAVEDALDSGLPRAYSPELYRKKCSAVFEHLYESYPERSVGVYSQVA